MASTCSTLVTDYNSCMRLIDFTSSLILEIELYGKTSEMVVLETSLLGTQRQSYACSNRPETKKEEQQKHIHKPVGQANRIRSPVPFGTKAAS